MAKKKKQELTSEELLAEALVREEDWPYEVPGNWVWTHWDTCGDLVAGNGFKPEYQGFADYEIPFYKVGSLKHAEQSGYLFEHENTINEEIRKKLKATLIPPNSILFAKIGEAIRLNRRCLNRIHCCIDNNLMAFIPYQFCDFRYGYYWTCYKEFYELANSTTVPAIRKSDLQAVPFPLPPLAEQQRIVDRIESLFDKLDQAKELIQEAQDSFKNRKAAILHQAFTGELTKKWREAHGVGLESWEEKALKKICKKITDGTHHSPQNSETGEFLYITAKNIKEYGIELANVTYISKQDHEAIYSRCNVEQGDVLYIKDGATTGIATINNLSVEFSLLSSVALLKPELTLLNPKYLVWNLNSAHTKSKMINNMSGNAITRLTITKIKEATIYVPTLSEQQEIVRILDDLFEKEQNAKDLCDLIDQIEAMKKTILGKAFRGELGTNVVGEESAVVLLREVVAIQ